MAWTGFLILFQAGLPDLQGIQHEQSSETSDLFIPRFFSDEFYA